MLFSTNVEIDTRKWPDGIYLVRIVATSTSAGVSAKAFEIRK
jgi:hypothetical protein